jgi:hypothetical protein
MVTNTAARLVAMLAVCAGIAGAIVSQVSPPPSPTVPSTTLPDAKPAEPLITTRMITL